MLRIIKAAFFFFFLMKNNITLMLKGEGERDKIYKHFQFVVYLYIFSKELII